MSSPLSGTLHVGWDQATTMSEQLGHSILTSIESGERPAYSRIVGLLRGGLHTTNIVSRMLGMTTEQVLAMGISKYDLTQSERPEHRIAIGQIPSQESVAGQHVLLIDDLVRTGETAACAGGILRGLGALSVDLGVLYDKSGSYNAVRTPDFSVATTDRWIEFAWQKFDNLGADSR